MSRHDMTAEEFLDSLTGFDEIAISKAFGKSVVALNEDPMTFARALVFVALRREGSTDADAKHNALSMTWGQVTDYFADDEPEVMPEDPSTDSGKDEPLPVMTQNGSLPSAS